MGTTSIRASLGPAPPAFSPDDPPLGLLLLDTRFQRAPGDLGRPDSWARPVIARVVREARPGRIVQPGHIDINADWLSPFVLSALELQAQGARAITTSCGFLVLMQAPLQHALRVPVVTSSLLLLPALLRNERRVGVLTISAASLGEGHLRSAGVPEGRLDDVVVQGVEPDAPFARGILGDVPGFDTATAGDDVVAAALSLRRRCPDLRTLVLECTNMPPFASRIREATGWSVLHLADAVDARCSTEGAG